MPHHENFDPQMPVTAIFWEGVSVGDTVAKLLRVGFPDNDIYALGVLAGSAPDLSDVFASFGIPAMDSIYFNECFQDGAIVLIIRVHTARDKRRALEVLQRSGGLLPPSWALPGSGRPQPTQPRENSRSRHL